DEASRQVWLSPDTGALNGMAGSAVAIESSTVTVTWVRELAEQCRTYGITFLDAPVAGSRPQAEAAQLIYLVGGDAGVVAKAEPILRAMGSAVHHAGPAGSGAAVKLAVNALLAVQVATMAELLGLMQCNGIDGARALEIVSSTPVCSPAARAAASAMLTRNFAPMFPIELVEKDLGYVLDAAEVSGARVPVTQAARHVYAEAIEQGHGADQMTGVSQLYL
ncbi:MAG: NAD(P)-dependent oxidoreductase, partial [Gemmatimonadaceae bacterium]|nr:NAD(P)-dependent oxidoreductase [Gloeobacterales cyanobacterium ES-bin-141]